MEPRILVVDSDPVERVHRQSSLIASGYPCDTTAAFDDALLKMRVEPYGLVLVDVGTLGQDAMGFVGEVRLRYPGVRVMLMAGMTSVEVMQRAWQCGALSTVGKPMDDSELFGKIRAALT